MLWHIIRTSLGLVCLAFALVACDQSQPVGQPLAIEGKTVATVNGVTIKEPELQALIEARSTSGQTPDRQQALDELIDMELLRQQAVAEGAHKNNEVKLQVNRSATNALISAFVRNMVDADPITDEELMAEYEKRFGKSSGAEYKSSHILSETEEEAKSNIAALKEGADFAELAKEKSTGPSASQGGSLGWASPDNYVAEFSSALKSLEPGEYTQAPVKTRFGWHVIQLEDTRQSEQPNIDRYKSQLERMIVNQRLQDYIAGLKKDASVNIVDESLKGADEADDGGEQSGEPASTDTGNADEAPEADDEPAAETAANPQEDKDQAAAE